MSGMDPIHRPDWAHRLPFPLSSASQTQHTPIVRPVPHVAPVLRQSEICITHGTPLASPGPCHMWCASWRWWRERWGGWGSVCSTDAGLAGMVVTCIRILDWLEWVARAVLILDCSEQVPCMWANPTHTVWHVGQLRAGSTTAGWMTGLCRPDSASNLYLWRSSIRVI